MRLRKAKQKMIFMLKIGMVNYKIRANRMGKSSDERLWKHNIRGSILFPTFLHVDVAEHKAKHKVLKPFVLDFLQNDVIKENVLKTYN